MLLEMIDDPAIRVYEGARATVRTGNEAQGGTTEVEAELAGDARYMAAEALAAIGPPANRPAVIKALAQAAGSSNEKTRKAATEALRRVQKSP